MPPALGEAGGEGRKEGERRGREEREGRAGKMRAEMGGWVGVRGVASPFSHAHVHCTCTACMYRHTFTALHAEYACTAPHALPQSGCTTSTY